ncbi:MAG: PA2779 family protein [Verrucomicrobiia bacterium]
MRVIGFGIVVVAATGIITAAVAAPVESVESARATTALRKVETFLSERAVEQQLTLLGFSKEQASTRLAQLSDAQLEQLAAQVDLIKAGGQIQGGNPNPSGPLYCLFKPLSRFLYDVYQLFFCWKDLK